MIETCLDLLSTVLMIAIPPGVFPRCSDCSDCSVVQDRGSGGGSSGRYLSDGGLEPVSSLLQGAHTVVTGCLCLTNSCLMETVGQCGHPVQYCVQEPGSTANCKLDHHLTLELLLARGGGGTATLTVASDINNFTRQSTFFCILTFFGGIVGK